MIRELGQTLGWINLFPDLIKGIVKTFQWVMSKCSGKNILVNIQQLPPLSGTRTFLKNLRKYLPLQSPFLNLLDLFHVIHVHWLRPYDNTNRAGGTRATGRRGGGRVCFAYFQLGVRKALTESPVVFRENELGSFFNDYLRVICFL